MTTRQVDLQELNQIRLVNQAGRSTGVESNKTSQPGAGNIIVSPLSCGKLKAFYLYNQCLWSPNLARWSLPYWAPVH